MAETIETAGGDAELKAELGDVLLQVVLHSRLAEERGAFGLDDVARGLTAKMVRRNPHVFRPDGSLQESFPATVEEIVRTWDAVKRAEQVLHSGAADAGAEPSRDPALILPGWGPSAASPAHSRRWPGRRNCSTAPNGPDCRPPPGRLTSRRRRRTWGSCCSPSRPPHGPRGWTPNAPSAAPTAASRRAGQRLRRMNRPRNPPNDVRGLDRFL